MKTDSPTYEISSFQDILDKVPFDRIEVCMAELGEVMATLAATHELMRIKAAEDGIPLPDGVLSTLKLPLTWKDDGKETHTMTMLTEGDEKFAELTISPKAEKS